jgi:hypothetical protein
MVTDVLLKNRTCRLPCPTFSAHIGKRSVGVAVRVGVGVDVGVGVAVGVGVGILDKNTNVNDLLDEG